MAKARMLHKKVSLSMQVNSLPLPAQLLFTWMISHVDDDGRLKGEPEYIKATVVPMKKWSFKQIEKHLLAIKDLGLIYYWEQNGEWFIELVKWKEHQQIQKDRYKPSDLPSFPNENGGNLYTSRIQPVNKSTPQSNIDESNSVKVNLSEYGKEESVADKNSFKKVGDLINPATYKPTSAVETAAYEAWKRLELNNPRAFYTTYIPAAKRGLPAELFYQFTSEIRQDPSIKNRGAVFNKKVDDYFNMKSNNGLS